MTTNYNILMKNLTEGSFDMLDNAEKAKINGIQNSQVKSGLANFISSMRSKGKQISLIQAAQQMVQYAEQQGMQVPELQKLAAAKDVVAPPNQMFQQQQPQQQSVVRTAPQTKLQQKVQQKLPQSNAPTFVSRTGKVAPLPPQITQHFKTLDQTANEISKSENKPEDEKWAEKAKRMKGSQKNQEWAEGPGFGGQAKKSYDPSAFEKTGKFAPPENKNMKKESFQKTMVQQILKEQAREQMSLSREIKFLLTEGPLANVWDGIKNAGSATLDKAGNTYRKLTGDAGKSDVDDKKKEIIQGISKTISKATQMRQKFNSEIMKNAGIMNQYHNAVLRVYELYNRFSDILGPAGLQVERQVNDMIGNLHYDLESEKEQIDALISAFGKAGKGLGKRAKEAAQQKREHEADASARMQSSFGRTEYKMPYEKGADDNVQVQKLALPPGHKLQTSKGEKKESPKESNKAEDMEKEYRQQHKELAKKAIGGDKEALKQLYKLTLRMKKMGIKPTNK